MSRTQKKSGSSSPVSKYISFKGGKGVLEYYDKSEEKKVQLDSVDFAIVDIKASVSGFNEGEASGISSNMLEPMETGEKEFIVKTKVNGQYGEVIRGVWKDIKAEAARFGAKYTINVFAVTDLGNGSELVKFEFNGGSLTPWIELLEDHPNEGIYDKLVTVSRGQLMKRVKGKNVEVTDTEYKSLLAKLKADPMADKPVMYYLPNFEVIDISEEQIEEAISFDAKLQEFFGEEFAKDIPVKDAEEVPAVVSGSEALDEEDDDLPF